MSNDYDFCITAKELRCVIEEFDLEDPQPLEFNGGFAGVLHTSEIRPELLTFELATVIYEQDSDLKARRKTDSVFHDVRQIIADLEPRSSWHVDHQRTVTYWKNVGVRPTEE